MKKISGVIMDWAGTAVDYGCFAPLNAFLKVFSEEKGIDITYRQAREPMGLLKIDHIKAILSMPEVNEKFRALYKRDWNKRDVDEMYTSFEKHLFASLKDFTTPIPGVLETMAMLRGIPSYLPWLTRFPKLCRTRRKPAAPVSLPPDAPISRIRSTTF